LSGELLHVALSGDIAVKVESAARLTSWQEGSLKSLVATLVAALKVSQCVVDPVPCIDPPKELTSSLAGVQGRSHLFKICLVEGVDLLTLASTLVHRAPELALDEAQECQT